MARFVGMLIAALLLFSVAAAAPPNPPSALVGPIAGSSATYYTYTTSATDPDGDQVKYTFDWGDGVKSSTSLVNSGVSIRMFHKWIVPTGATKTFDLRVMATDASGAASEWSATTGVTITGPVGVNRPPTTPSVPSGSTSGSSGKSYSYSTSATDPDGDQVKYTFDWGDGSTFTTPLVGSGTSASAAHIWTVPPGSTKTFSVTAEATDKNGMESSSSSPLSISVTGSADGNKPPATPYVPSGCMTGKSGMAYRYYTKGTDSDGDQVKYIFDWGDGTTSTTSLVSSGTSASASHIWTLAPGTRKTFYVAAKAIDEHGIDSSWSTTLPVIIVAAKENHPPNIPSIPSGPTNGVSGESYSFSTSSTDSDGDMIKYIFDWGDGNTETGFFPSGQVVTASHSWNTGSTRGYNVRATAIDSHFVLCPAPYWSDYLRVTITGP